MCNCFMDEQHFYHSVKQRFALTRSRLKNAVNITRSYSGTWRARYCLHSIPTSASSSVLLEIILKITIIIHSSLEHQASFILTALFCRYRLIHSFYNKDLNRMNVPAFKMSSQRLLSWAEFHRGREEFPAPIMLLEVELLFFKHKVSSTQLKNSGRDRARKRGQREEGLQGSDKEDEKRELSC